MNYQNKIQIQNQIYKSGRSQCTLFKLPTQNHKETLTQQIVRNENICIL